MAAQKVFSVSTMNTYSMTARAPAPAAGCPRHRLNFALEIETGAARSYCGSWPGWWEQKARRARSPV